MEDGGSGGHSIAGYEYQIDVSLWLALDLVLANRLAQELILEPASEEDIPGHEEFARELYRRIRRVVHLQQVILPHSDVHHDETTVFHSANELRAAYEWIGGDARIKDTRGVEHMQMWEYAQAHIEQREPTLSFDASCEAEEAAETAAGQGKTTPQESAKRRSIVQSRLAMLHAGSPRTPFKAVFKDVFADCERLKRSNRPAKPCW